MRKLIFLLLAAAAMPAAQAKVTLSGLFSDNMVLQQQQNVRIWGQSDKKEVTLTASWNNKPVRTTVHDGRWEAVIATPAGSYAPQSLTVSDADSKITLGNVLIGEVWICSGQSNMTMPLRGYTGQPVEESMRTALESPKYRDRIRMITLRRLSPEKPVRDFEGAWDVPEPETSLRMSAVGYFFARALTEAIDLPVGIVSTSWGGSKIETWMDEASLRELGYDIWQINSDTTRSVRAKCTLLYNGMIAPVAGFAARGFVWYQGEANQGQSRIYAQLMQKLVAYWRSQWGDDKAAMPFLYAQIAPYAYSNADSLGAVRVMEAQCDALGLIPNSAMVSTTDIGDREFIHPPKKRPVGERLAAEALVKAYGMKFTDGSSVTFKGVEYKDGKAIVTFNNAHNGMMPQGEAVIGFELAGADGVYHPATGAIVKSKPIVEVTSPEVPNPVAVRYAFHNYTTSNLANTLGLPVVPFRSVRE